MKKFIFMLIVVFSCSVFSAVNSTKTVISVPNSDMVVMKIVLSDANAQSTETQTFDFQGTALRIVVDVNDVDADGDITISDISGKNYLTLTDKLGSGDIDYIINSTDQNSNVYGGVPIFGTHTITLTDCAVACPMTIYIYLKK